MHSMVARTYGDMFLKPSRMGDANSVSYASQRVAHWCVSCYMLLKATLSRRGELSALRRVL